MLRKVSLCAGRLAELQNERDEYRLKEAVAKGLLGAATDRAKQAEEDSTRYLLRAEAAEAALTARASGAEHESARERAIQATAKGWNGDISEYATAIVDDVLTAYLATPSGRTHPAPAEGASGREAAVREAAQKVIDEGRIASGGIRRPAKWIQIPAETFGRLKAALSAAPAPTDAATSEEGKR